MPSEDMFKRGFAEACRDAGIDDWQSVFPDVGAHYSLYSLNPDKFMEGFRETVKSAQVVMPPPARPGGKSWAERQVDDFSWDKAKKWLLGAGLLALGAGYGSMWGRYANATGNTRGPVLGPILGIRDKIKDTALNNMASGVVREYGGQEGQQDV